MVARRKASTRRLNGRRYSEAERAVAVQTVRAAGSSVTLDSLKNVQLILKAPQLSFNTLVAWVRTASAAPKMDTANIDDGTAISTQVDSELNVAKSALEMWRAARVAYLNQATKVDVIQKTDGKDAIAAAERAQKMEQLLDGLPTEIIGAAGELTELVNFLRSEGLELSPAIRQWREQLQARKAATKVKQEGVSNG